MTSAADRNSSATALLQLRTLRMVRLAERAEQAKPMPEPPEVQAPQPAGCGCRARRDSTAEPVRTSEPVPQRTTLERIASLRGELIQLASKRAQRQWERQARIDALRERLGRRDAPWAPALCAAAAAAMTFYVALYYSPAISPLSLSAFAPEPDAQALLTPRDLAPRFGTAGASHGARQAEEVLRATPGPAAVPHRRPTPSAGARGQGPSPKASTSPTAQAAPTPAPGAAAEATDPLARIEDCADDPICGL